MKVYKAVHERENKCKELHKEMNMNAGPTRLVQPDFYLLVDVDDIQKQVNALENQVNRMKSNLADDIEKNNPGAKELRMWAENNTVKPELKETIKIKKPNLK